MITDRDRAKAARLARILTVPDEIELERARMDVRRALKIAYMERNHERNKVLLHVQDMSYSREAADYQIRHIEAGWQLRLQELEDHLVQLERIEVHDGAHWVMIPRADDPSDFTILTESLALFDE